MGTTKRWTQLLCLLPDKQIELIYWTFEYLGRSGTPDDPKKIYLLLTWKAFETMSIIEKQICCSIKSLRLSGTIVSPLFMAQSKIYLYKILTLAELTMK
jgi:hypothetical protein